MSRPGYGWSQPVSPAVGQWNPGLNSEREGEREEGRERGKEGGREGGREAREGEDNDNITYYQWQQYSETALFWTSLGEKKVLLSVRCPDFRGISEYQNVYCLSVSSFQSVLIKRFHSTHILT